MSTEIFTRKEAAQKLKIKPDTLRHWEKQGFIKASLNIRRSPRYTEEDLKKVLTPNS